MSFKSLFTQSFLLIFALLFSRCNNCKDLGPITLHAGRNLTATGVFQPGSYWIYVNDSTFQADSVVITNSVYDPQPVYGPCGSHDSGIVSNKEFFLTYLTSFTFNINYLLTTGVDQPVLLSEDDLAADTIFVDGSCIDSAVCNTYDSLQVRALRFYNVRERIDSVSNIENGNLVHYFTANGLGIIKKQIYEPGSIIESWSLVRWHLIQ